jgi:type IV pilus assembly protein PilV
MSKVLSKGFTLVEVMVAMMVLSIGLLGIAKLAFSSVQSNSSAYMRTQASELTQEIFDAMRANRNQAALGTYNVAIGAFPGAGTNCSQAVCTDVLMAAYDVSVWKARLAATFPGGDGSVVTALAVNANNNQEVTVVVTVQWNDAVAQQTFGQGGNQTLSVVAESVL